MQFDKTKHSADTLNRIKESNEEKIKENYLHNKHKTMEDINDRINIYKEHFKNLITKKVRNDIKVNEANINESKLNEDGTNEDKNDVKIDDINEVKTSEVKVNEVKEENNEEFNENINENDIERIKAIIEGLEIFRYFLDNDMMFLTDKERYEKIKIKSVQFIKKHPVVVDYLTSKGIYDADAFIKYINRLYNSDIQSKEEYHYEKSQAAYYRYLANKVKSDTPPNIKKREKEIFEQLKANTDELKNKTHKIKEEYTKSQNEFYSERKKELSNLLIKQYASKSGSC